ncbi:MAG: 1-deoxy-D-xylulose-5-phosphate synthase [Alphaproteobacteria bacterium]|nr:1-deoxy-D-xylulose-5-phosphate synthase [Alphaproteobacteria bacterium]
MTQAERKIIADPIDRADPSEKEGFLTRVNFPEDIKQLSSQQLVALCSELRDFMIATVAKTGGHLGAGLGVVELSVALHKVFNTPKDKIIWDVGHQSYPHKILTGRKDLMHTIRQGDGLSGFTKRSESPHDPFGTGHSSTSISAGLGMAVARDIDNPNTPHHVICVIGDGSISAGMAYEAMNNAGCMTINDKKTRLIVILNDNDMSIAPPVGALSRHLTKLVSSSPYTHARELGKRITDKLPSLLRHVVKRSEKHVRNVLGSGSIFEELGFYYIGPVDGHNLEDLISILNNVRDSVHNGPILIHAVTKKGKGYTPAEKAADKMHGVKKFDVITGTQIKSSHQSTAPSYTEVFAQSLIECARKDSKILGITAAMSSGTGLTLFEKEFPDRFFDVGIAEQHAVTFAAGLAVEGYKPFIAIYSTFMQRAYDQIIHDVALQNLPVRFAIDRAGLVGADGQTHAGSFDIAYLSCIPNMVLMAASDEAELASMVATAAAYDEGPIAFRYPRGEGVGIDIPSAPEIIPIGKGRLIHEGKKIALINLGSHLKECRIAAKIIKEQHNLDITIADARFAKPIDTELLKKLAKNHEILITIEEGSRGGFGSSALEFLSNTRLMDKSLKVRTMTLPDRFQPQDTMDKQYREAGLDAAQIVIFVTSLL